MGWNGAILAEKDVLTGAEGVKKAEKEVFEGFLGKIVKKLLIF